jgi:phospholipid-transporting ATPase
MPNRSIITNVVDYETCTNQIKTSKYTAWNFIPLNLYFQFSKIANLYFLMVGIMQMIPEISISGGMPVIFMPLSLVVFVSAIKDVFEDLKRKKSDNELNNMQTRVLADRGF